MIFDVSNAPILGQKRCVFSNVQFGAFPFLVQKIVGQASEQWVTVICRDAAQMDHLAAELEYLCPDVSILSIPEWDTIPYDRVSPSRDLMARRVAALEALKKQENAAGILLTTFRALGQKVISPKAFSFQRVRLKPGDVFPYQDFITALGEQGLERVDVVREAGTYAVRGGLIDVFPLGALEPVRIDFFGEEVESLKTFDPMSQRSLEGCTELVLGGGAELIVTPEKASAFRIRYLQAFGVEAGKDALIQQLLSGVHPAGIEQWLPFFYEELSSLLEWLPQNSVVLSYGAFEAQADEMYQQACSYYEQRTHDLKERDSVRGQADLMPAYRPVPLDSFYQDGATLFAELEERNLIEAVSFDHPEGIDLKTRSVLIDSKKPLQSVLSACETFEGKTLLSVASSKQLMHLKSVFHAQETLELTEKKNIQNALKAKASEGKVFVVVSPLGWSFQTPGLQLITAQDIFGILPSLGQGKKKSSRLVSLQDINAYEEGDFLVHREHGVGRFVGLVSLTLDGYTHECVALEYAEDNKLYVPVENLDVLTKYAGKESEASLDRLGTVHWQKRAAKVKEKLFEVAASLMALAAQRQLQAGTSFEIDFPEYKEFCAQFPYVETQDQLTAIAQIEEDLQTEAPMDRLICGDVGFGKTEVAMRACFLAAMNGLQVLVLTPTTVLCRQHTQNFLKRFEGFPVRIGQLSRFTKPKERMETLAALKQGELDILIATHGVFSSSVTFKDLGLVVVDEEQHFGVMQKEYLKNLAPNVNVLAMSATPIPRTLQLAVAGVRGLSLIASPPVDRMAVKSQVMPFDGMVVRDAILREIQRGGQVYFVCPRLKDLDEMSQTLKRLVPEVSVGVGHGQLSTQELDQVMSAFYEGTYQVLLATNIVESGLDVPNANTMIVYKSEYFGLSQLYQLKGRVGRSKKKAYAYFMTAFEHPPQSKAYRRLEVIQSLDRLGAGFMVASHDMDLRGAGNLVGKAQSGHVKEVGYELYQEMLKEAVETLQAEKRQGPEAEHAPRGGFSPRLNLGITAFIPEEYVPDLSVRMGLYRRVSQLASAVDVAAFSEELQDRFGRFPEPVQRLIESVQLKLLCKQAHVEKIDRGTKAFVLTFYQEQPLNPEKMIGYVSKNMAKVQLRPNGRLLYLKTFDDETEMISALTAFLAELIHQTA